MTRPRNKGPAVSYRLPLSLHRRLAELAEKAGLSLGDYTAKVVTASLAEPYMTPVASARRAEAKAVNGHALECDHPRPAQAPVAGGLKRCRVCGRVRGIDGVWR